MIEKGLELGCEWQSADDLRFKLLKLLGCHTLRQFVTGLSQVCHTLSC